MMAAERYEGTYGRSLEIDVCHACNGLWFDGRESVLLTPGSTIRLFQSMYERAAAARATLVAAPGCPRCPERLVERSDQVKATRFSFLQCAQHGRFITFFQWLREKNLVRSLSPVELLELKSRVKFVDCGNCGAPVSLETTSMCPHCQAPLSILAPDSIAETLKEMQEKELARTSVKPELLFEAMTVSARLDRSLPTRPWAGDLIMAGLRGLFGVLTRR